jgi:ATP-dependent RNA helicase DeaD
MNSFKNRAAEILVATDVAARGIDVSGVDAVFNYDLPQDNEYYIHRIGRTGRAGRTGTAYTLISGRRQLFDLRAIEKYTHAEIKELPLPERSDIIAMKKEAMIKDVSEAQAGHNAYDILDRLAGMGIDYREAAARILEKQLRAETESLPDLENARPLRKGRNSGAKTARIVINIGRNRRIAPNFILGALVDATGMTGKDFGKIDIYDEHTTVEVPETECEYIIDSTDSMKINGNKVEVKLYKGSPFAEHRSRRPDDKPRFDRKKAAYGSRKRSEVYSDYIPNRKKRTKKRH